MHLNDPQTYYRLKKGSCAGWVGVNSNGHITTAAEPFEDLVGKRLAHLPAEWSVVRLAGVAQIPREAL